MRICFLANGQSFHTYNWIRYFAKAGHEIHLITVDGYRFEPLTNLTVHIVPRAFPNTIRFVSYFVNSLFGPVINSFKIRNLIKGINPDIVHAHYLTDYGFLGYLTHFPAFVVTLWGSDILIAPKESLFHRLMVRPILNSAKLITVNSDNVRRECLEYCNCPEKISIVLWGVDLTIFRQRTDYGRHRTTFTVLSTREFSPLYNIDTIIQSIPSVIRTRSDVKYILKTKGAENPELQQIVRSLNVGEFIEFNYTKIEYPEFSAFHHQADIFISVPSSDSSSISLLEAMACGLAVIVSDLPANHEWITDGWNGFIVPVRDPEELAEAILRLVGNPDLIRLFGERNAQIVRDRADRKKHMEHMEELYKQLAEHA
jgi:L-malate glycosyltransferase